VSSGEHEVATLGGGCFWCLEAVYDQLKGVKKVVSGYAGGTVPNPSYRQVCSGVTGHAEVVQITYDPNAITFRELLEVFFDIHDPTTLNRSAIFYHDEEQKKIAEEMIEELEAEGRWASPIVTQVVPLDAFYEAEEYHQDYYKDNPRQPYCRAVVGPKVAKFKKQYKPKLKH